MYRNHLPRNLPLDRNSREHLERFIRSQDNFLDPQNYLRTLAQITAQICLIQVRYRGQAFNGQEGTGTGLLVSSDIILTNYHVVEELIHSSEMQKCDKAWSHPDDLLIRFEYFGNDEAERSPRLDFKLHATEWLVAFSEKYPKGLDYALLRIEKDAANQRCSTLSIQSNVTRRGFINLLDCDTNGLKENSDVIMLQHPKAAPLKLAVGRIVSIDENERIIEYDVTTAIGSSGSPCFNVHGVLVGLHRAKQEYNRGVHLKWIIDDLGTNWSKVLAELKEQNNSPIRKHIEAKIDDNPFVEAGPLVKNAESYIPRKCDHELKLSIESNQFIAISGEYEIGKSSLLMNAPQPTGGTWKFIPIDFMALRWDDENLFIMGFFERVSKFLERRIETWTELLKTVAAQPVIFQLDEFGVMSKQVTSSFVPTLLSNLSKVRNTSRILVCVPEPIDKILSAKGVDREKFHRQWKEINIEPFSVQNTLDLLELLPVPARQVAYEQIDLIVEYTAGRPRALQLLSSRLFDSMQDNLSKDVMENIIQRPESYK
ncbi:MAG: serine protease [Chloroflexota bacterium]